MSCQDVCGMPPLLGCSSNFDAGGGRRDGSADPGSSVGGGDRVSCLLSLRWSWLFPNDVVQRDDKDDDSYNDWEPPVIFAIEVDARAVDFDNGDGSIVDLDRRDGKKCRDGEDSSTDDVGLNFQFYLKEDPPAVGVAPR